MGNKLLFFLNLLVLYLVMFFVVKLEVFFNVITISAECSKKLSSHGLIQIIFKYNQPFIHLKCLKNR